MSQELLYTSAPHGLKPGSRGFCTVLSTQGMPAPLATGLEALSGYRPVFPPSDSRAHLNPVVWSHVTLTVAGRAWHVLSRISDFGLDYSQRTNKLAHHVVVDPGEQVECGPAQLLGLSGFMRSDWDHEPRLVPPKPTRQMTAAPPGICRAWKEMTGDAGWAGVLAESYLREPERPVFLLYEPGQEILPLIAEALSLLPPERRWEVTFSTYFTGLPQGVGCVWRCMLKDSPEAQQSRRFAKALRIDLTGDPAGPATGGELVELARKGAPQAPLRPLRSPVRPDRGTQFSTESAASGHGPDDDSNDIIFEDDSQTPPAPPALTGGTFQRKERGPFELLERDPGRRTLADVHRELHQRSRRRWMLTGVVVFSMALLGTLGFVGFKYRHLLEKPPKVHEVMAGAAPVAAPIPKHVSKVVEKPAPPNDRATPAMTLNPIPTSTAEIQSDPNGETIKPPVIDAAKPTAMSPISAKNETASTTTPKEKVLSAKREWTSINDEKQITELLKKRPGGKADGFEVVEVLPAPATAVNIQLLVPDKCRLKLTKRQSQFDSFEVTLPALTGANVDVGLLTFQTNFKSPPPRLRVNPKHEQLVKPTELGWCVADVLFNEGKERKQVRLGFIQEPLPHFCAVQIGAEGNVSYSLPKSFASRNVINLFVDSVDISIGTEIFKFEILGEQLRSSQFEDFIRDLDESKDPEVKCEYQWSVRHELGDTIADERSPRMSSIELKCEGWRQVRIDCEKSIRTAAASWAKEITKSFHKNINDPDKKRLEKTINEIRDLTSVMPADFDMHWSGFERFISQEDNMKSESKLALHRLLAHMQRLRELHSAHVVAASIYYNLSDSNESKRVSRRYLVNIDKPE